MGAEFVYVDPAFHPMCGSVCRLFDCDRGLLGNISPLDEGLCRGFVSVLAGCCCCSDDVVTDAAAVWA